MKLCATCKQPYAWGPICERCLGLNLARRCEFIEFTVKAPLEVREQLTETAYTHEFGDLVEVSR